MNRFFFGCSFPANENLKHCHINMRCGGTVDMCFSKKKKNNDISLFLIQIIYSQSVDSRHISLPLLKIFLRTLRIEFIFDIEESFLFIHHSYE